ncbi:hypothetical protein, partial [Pseudomonas sp. yb_9]|uniref:hypothetical protein n=1 Tax=Pseudomonas sp. yb_9 TaxID=3367222 RepID=UPI003709D997
WSNLIDGPLSKAARAEVDRKYRATSDLPLGVALDYPMSRAGDGRSTADRRQIDGRSTADRRQIDGR